MKLVLTLRDTKGELDPYTVKFKIKDTALAKHWTELLISNILSSNHPIEKTYCLHSWQTDWYSDYSRNLEFLCRELNKSIKVVNDNMNPLGYPFIDLEFTVEKLRSKHYRSLMNDIHHHFEILIGQVWDVSEWYKKTPDDKTRTAIRMLNNYCHEIESNIESIKQAKALAPLRLFNLDMHPSLRIHISLNGIDPKGNYYFDKRVEPLTLEDFNCFQQDSKWGDVSIYYAQLGKAHLDAYFDADEHIDRKNISSHQTITGETNIDFFLGRQKLTRRFLRWCKKHGFDTNDKSLGIGYPVVAEIINPEKDRRSLEKQLRARDDLHQIAVEDDQDNVIMSKTYDYTWQDEEGWKNENLS